MIRRVVETGLLFVFLPPLLGVILLLAWVAPAGFWLLLLGIGVWKLHWLRRELTP